MQATWRNLRAPVSDVSGMRFEATTAQLYPHAGRATAALRGELRRQMAERGLTEPPDWSTLEISGPDTFTDLTGRTWFSWTAQFDSR